MVADGTIVTTTWARLEGSRPRKAGCNARLGEHGQIVRPAIARVGTADGRSGFGWAGRLTPEGAEALLGRSLSEAFVGLGEGDLLSSGVSELFQPIEYPLYDLMGKAAAKPVYALLGGQADPDGIYRVPCYDTSLYIDDLQLDEDAAAAALMAAEAVEGAARGHRAFKVKVGRGAMHMELEGGTRRDIAVVRAVRQAVGASARLMIDANNGYNLNLARRVLAETAEARLYWIEEAFHEDPRLYECLKAWLAAEGIATLIADGEGDASPRLLDWARMHLIDIVQYDVLNPGLSRWLELGPELDAGGVRSAPHHYGEPFGNYACCHLAPAIRGFEAVEWDEANVPGMDGSAYRIVEGQVWVPDLPGFGLGWDEELFAGRVAGDGFSVTL